MSKNDLPLVERYSLPLKVQEEVCVKEVIYTPAGEAVLDFGQNFSGYTTYMSQMKKGEILKLSFCEVLQDGNFYRGNYRTAKAEYVYRSNGEARALNPHFTYYGFRYVKVEGLETINEEDFCGKVLYSTMKQTGGFHSSNPHLDRLYQNTIWGLKSNFVDMPTDCPQRDERLGWTGDAQVFSKTASYHMNTKAFFQKYLRDLRMDQQKHEGKIAMYLPNLQPGLSCAVWGDAATIIPTVLYQYYGDKELLKEEYPLMKDWVNSITREDEKRGKKYLWDFGFQLGDWLALDGVTPQSMLGATDVQFIASAYYYGSVTMTAEAAEILSYSEESQEYMKLADRIKDAILYHYYTPSGKLAVDTQTAYYVALHFGLYRSKDILIEALKKRLKKDCYRIKSGFVGAPLMCNVLSEAGLIDIAYDFLFYQDYPGWLYEVGMGATTIWERWNSVMPDGKISDTGMNSLNHYAYGSVAEFLYSYTAGIRSKEPGFKRVIIAPSFTSYLEWIECSFDAAIGKYVVRWSIEEDGSAKVYVEVPFGAEAEIELPDSDQDSVIVGAGIYEYHYKPARDYRYLFNENSRLDQIMRNEEAKEVCERECRGLAAMLKSNDEETLSQSLGELAKSMFSGLPKEELKEAMKQLLTIKR